jgi:hypothetical protein
MKTKAVGGHPPVAKMAAGLCTILALSAPKLSSASEALSTLTSGNFNRQLELPKTSPVSPESPLGKEVSKIYATTNVSPGERIRYAVTYLGVSAGDAEITLQPAVQHANSWAHRITAEVKSSNWYSWLVKLHDSVEEISAEGLQFTPVKFYINQLEKDYQSTKLLEYNPGSLSVRQRSKKLGQAEVEKEFRYPKGTKEALGALYYLRTQLASSHPPPLHLEFPIFTSEKTWTGKASYRGSETRKIDGNKYETDVYHLVTTFGGLMEQKGDIRIWFTKDERKLPIYIEAYIKFGFIKVTLYEWDPGELQKAKFKPIRHDL